MGKYGLVEKYGNPRLVWGYYPVSEDYNSGGCIGNCGQAQPADSIAAIKAQQRLIGMVHRGGNNPFKFQEIPAYTQYEVGTGCYNPNCMCDNCHGDCLCERGAANMTNIPNIANLFENNTFKFIGLAVLAYFIYNLFIKRR